ncbi:MAG: hypothetical protein AAF799_25695 [Myxococcota bacterium]
MRLRAALAVLGVVSCGPSVTPAGSAGSSSGTGGTTASGADSTGVDDPFGLELFGSGSRLLVRILEAPGGARQFVSFHDQELGVDCQFFDTPDAGLRCLPAVVALGVVNAEETLTFADGECTTPGLLLPGNYPQFEVWSLNEGDFVTTAFGSRRCAGLPVRATAHRLAREVSSLYEGDDCELASDSKVGDRVFALEEADLGVFVAGQLVDADGIRRLVADDGTWRNLYMRDDDGEPCKPFFSEDNPRCAPLDMAFAGIPPVLCYEGSSGSCDGARVASVVHRLDYCEGDVLHAYSFNESATSIQVHPVLGPSEVAECTTRTGCVPSEETTTLYDEVVRVGEPLPESTFPALERFDAGGGPLVTHLLRRQPNDVPAPVGPFANSPRFFDPRFAAECYVEDVGTEQWCLVNGTRSVENWRHFSDPACTEPMVEAFDFSVTVLLFGAAAVEGAGSDGFSYWMAELIETTTPYVLAGGECQLEERPSGRPFVRPVDEVPADSVRLTELLE